MKEIRVVCWDDLHKADGENVPASHEDIPLQLGPRKVLLDLTSEHYTELEKLLDRWLDAGTAGSREPAGKQGSPARKPHRSLQPGRRRNKKMRDFAEANGFEIRKLSKPDGSYSYYYPTALKKAFAAWEESQAS